MSRKVRLQAPKGTDEANWSGSPVPYRVDNDGYAEVDEEAVGPLLEKGGFILEPDPVEVAHGNIRVKHVSDPAALCAHGGEQFSLQPDGSLVVPVEAVAHLKAHGFHPLPEAPPAEVAPEAPPAPKGKAKAAADPAPDPTPAAEPAPEASPSAA